MMRLFSEKVQPTLTNSNYNILQVNDYNEIFFGVYEIEINKAKYPVEKISEHNGNPVVSVPVTVKGVKSYYPFVLSKGKFEVLFNEHNTDANLNNEPLLIDDEVILEPPNYPQLVEEEVPHFNLVDHKDIFEQIEKAKKEAVYLASKIKKQKLQEADEIIKSKEKALKEMVRDARISLITEFLSISKKIKKECIDENDNRFDEISQTIDNKIEDLSDSLYESIKTDLDSSSIQLESKIKELVDEISISLQPKIDEELKNIALEIVEKVVSIEKNLDDKLSDKADKTLIENVEDELASVVKSNIELNDKLNKGVNKALSRTGNIDKKVDELTIALSEEVENKISKAEESITQYYTEKLKMLEEKTFDITEETRKYIIDLVTESRNNLIKEIREIKNEKPIEYIVESKGKKQTINSDDLVKDFDKKISSKIDTEVTRLRKYIAVYSGGGSVAMQFADGGTMNGNLNVNGNITTMGTISASQYLGLPDQFADGGTMNGNLNVNGNVTIMGTISASQYLGLPDAVGGSSVEYEWSYATSEVMSDPGNGKVRSNSTLSVNVTELAVSRQDSNNIDTLFTLAGISIGDLIFAQEKGNADNWTRFSVRSTPINNGTWFFIPVSYIANGGAPASKNTDILAKFNYNTWIEISPVNESNSIIGLSIFL